MHWRRGVESPTRYKGGLGEWYDNSVVNWDSQL